MTAKLIRHPDQLVLVGAPTSAAAAAKGVENGPEALRAAGIADRLRQVGYQVTDVGDLPVQLPQSDPDNPRARNMKGVLAMLDPLRLRIEQSAKSHAFPLVLGGAVTGAVVVLIIAPPLIVQLISDASSWVPSALAITLSGVEPEAAGMESQPAAGAAILALAGWAFVPALIGLVSVQRRDVV